MSIILALREEKTVHLLADTQATLGDSLKISMKHKLFKDSDKKYIIGCVGEGKFFNLIRYHPFPYYGSVSWSQMSPHEFMIRVFVPSIFEVLAPLKSSTDEESSLFNLLVAWGSNMFTVQHDGTVLEYEDYAAIGSPQAEALVSFKLLKTLSYPMSPREKLYLIMDALETHCNYISFPCVYLHTGDLENV